MFRRALLGLSRNERAKTLLTRAPVTAEVVARFVAGETTDEVVTAPVRYRGRSAATTTTSARTRRAGRTPSGW